MTLRKSLRVYLPFARSEIQREMAYRFRLVLWILSDYVYLVASYFLWRAIFASTDTGMIGTFAFTDMVAYILLIFAVGRITGSPAGWFIGMEVQDGSIAMNLIRPISYSTRIFFCAMGGNLFNTIVMAGPLFIIIGVFFNDAMALHQIGFFLVSMFLSFCVYHFFDMCFGMISFYTTYVWGLQILKYSLLRFLSGALIPFAFLPDGLERFFELLPIAGLAYTPVMIFLGNYQGSEILLFMGLQVFWALFFWGLSVLLWRWAIKRLTILGG